MVLLQQRVERRYLHLINEALNREDVSTGVNVLQGYGTRHQQVLLSSFGEATIQSGIETCAGEDLFLGGWDPSIVTAVSECIEEHTVLFLC